MQDWKIKRMSVKLLERWLIAIGRLLGHYLGIRELDWLDCPICFAPCEDCLWKIIEGKDCSEFRIELYPDIYKETSDFRRNPNIYRKWKKARISQLQKWEKIMTLELERRKNEKRKRTKKET